MNATTVNAIHRVTWRGNVPHFACEGDRTSPCHVYPDCECVYWTLDANGQHAHADTPHDRCWRLDWLEATPLESYFDGGTGTGDVPPRIDGLIETEWEGECLLWCYADDSVVEAYFARAEVVLPLIRERARSLTDGIPIDDVVRTPGLYERAILNVLVDLIDVIDQLTPRTEETAP